MTEIAGVTKTVTTDPYEQGGRAWFNSVPVTACPHHIPGERATKWVAGWHAAEDEFRAAGVTVVDVELGEAGA